MTLGVRRLMRNALCPVRVMMVRRRRRSHRNPVIQDHTDRCSQSVIRIGEILPFVNGSWILSMESELLSMLGEMRTPCVAQWMFRRRARMTHLMLPYHRSVLIMLIRFLTSVMLGVVYTLVPLMMKEVTLVRIAWMMIRG
jgi:hypothetical protein